MLKQVVIVGLGGAIGAIFRYSLNVLFQVFEGRLRNIINLNFSEKIKANQDLTVWYKLVTIFYFPYGVWSTILVNWLGCLGLGIFLKNKMVNYDVTWFSNSFFIQIGVIASFTTFSSFIAEIFKVYEKDGVVPLSGYLFLQLFGGVFSFYLGQKIMG